ncbi:unnamed protein product [Cunninghamella blakesleeana]
MMSENNMCFEFLLLTSDEPPLPIEDDNYMNNNEKEIQTWMDDSLCQENLMDIVVLSPEESTTDSSNHICTSNQYKFFFEELGYFTEEPGPIDPTMDYEKEYNERLKLQKESYKGKKSRYRQQHIHLSGSNTPSLLLDDATTNNNNTMISSGVSSTSSSFIMHYDQPHHHHHHPIDLRSNLYLNHSSSSPSSTSSYNHHFHHHTLSHSNNHHHIPYSCNNVNLEKHHPLRHVH